MPPLCVLERIVTRDTLLTIGELKEEDEMEDEEGSCHATRS